MNSATHILGSRLTRKSLSLSHRGAWGQVTVAAFLITILPSLILAWVFDGTILPPMATWGAGGVVVAVISLGYALLIKYPVNIVRLRRYLSTLAGGGIPDQVTLTEDEDDLAAVKRYMEHIVKLAEDRIKMLETRHLVKLEAERQRVMVESIGAMCHHLGQPATVMSLCLYRMKKASTPQEMTQLLADCEEAFGSMTQILEQLRAISHYSTEPYLPLSSQLPNEPEARILKV